MSHQAKKIEKKTHQMKLIVLSLELLLLVFLLLQLWGRFQPGIQRTSNGMQVLVTGHMAECFCYRSIVNMSSRPSDRPF